MSETTYLDTLSEAERSELHLCGISTDAQLRKVSAAHLWKDIQQAREFFPDREFTLTEERIQQIIAHTPLAIESVEENVATTLPEHRGLVITRSPVKSEFFHTVRMDGRDANINPETTAERILHAEKVNGLSRDFHAICCTHPHRTYLGAGATALLIPAMIALIVFPIMLFYGYKPLGDNPYVYGAIVGGLAFPYFVFLHMAYCPVCHIKLYTFRPYPHHKGSHNMPFLGPTFATALHILAFFQFRCPACGTQLKLFGSSRNRRRRSKKAIRIRNKEQKELYKTSTRY